MARGPSYSECPRPVPSPRAHLASGGEEEAQAGGARQQRQEALAVSKKSSSGRWEISSRCKRSSAINSGHQRFCNIQQQQAGTPCHLLCSHFFFSFGSLVLAARLDLLGVVSGIAGQSALNECICVCTDILLYRVPSLTQNINLQNSWQDLVIDLGIDRVPAN
jgi:hypothetical protein